MAMSDAAYQRVLKQVRRGGDDDDLAERHEQALDLLDQQRVIIANLQAQVAVLAEWKVLYSDLAADVRAHLVECLGRS